MNNKTLRDEFAMAATEKDIQQYLPSTVREDAEFKKKNGFSATREWARYQFADAMLKARETKEPEPEENHTPHNPDNLTPEQVGVKDGWRLLD